MMSITSYTPCSSKFSCSPAINALESSLLISLSNLKDLVLEFENLFISSENYKTQYMELKDKCESNSCKSSEVLKEVIVAKDKIIQSAASALTKLNETKNFNIINEIFKILCGDTSPPTPNKTKLSPIIPQAAVSSVKKEIKMEPESPIYSPEKDLIVESNVKEEKSLIEGTPTGRTSPIIQPRKFRSTNSSTDFREKKKCPDNWDSSENKAIKLTYYNTITPTKKTQCKNGLRLKQSKLNLVKVKQSNSIDLTGSPDFSGGVRVKKSESLSGVQPLIKKESIESEDTILPSPTSGPTNFSALYKSAAKNSPTKFKTPLSLSRLKSENASKDKRCESPDATNIEESINLLQPNRKNGLKRQSPVKSPFIDDKDITDCETQNDDSISLLQAIKILEANQENVGRNTSSASPSKRPLMENKNIMNIPEDMHIESSLSVLGREIKVPTEDKGRSPSKRPLMENKNIMNIPEDVHIVSSLSVLSREIKVPTEDKGGRRLPDPVEDIYKEPTVRKKAEKRRLPGWSCNECKEFYDELYKDDPEMLAKKMDECSKHRGRHNPVRPKTPDNYWNPRWDVPQDTEEFNKRNNAV